MNSAGFSHQSVLLHEAVAALALEPGMTAVDATAGGGGHSREIAQVLGSVGRLICLDQDPDAVHILRERLGTYPQVTVVQENFSAMDTVLDSLGISAVNAVLMDLGVSSHQLDTGERGFSYHQDAPLDMRMSQTGLSAADVVNTYSQDALKRILFVYGEEKFAPQIAAGIVRRRETGPIATTLELVDVIRRSVPAAYCRGKRHPARRTFQAVRIEVNGELERLEQALDLSLERLDAGGRLAVITFHSLEDKIVKAKFRTWSQGCTCPKDFPVCVCGKRPKGRALKPVLPVGEELERNPRSRSAKLRTLVKLDESQG